MVYFLSDAHLGSRVVTNHEQHMEHVISLLKQMENDADAVYLLGDIFDFWYEYVWDFARRCKEKNFAPLLNQLQHMTQIGIHVHFFIGNHDIWTFGWLAKRTGVTIHKKHLDTEIYGKKVFLAHGDGLVPSDFLSRLPEDMRKKIRRFIRLRAFFHHPVPQLLFRLLPPYLGDAFGYEWARRSRQKELNNPCGYKGENHEELVLYAKEQETAGTQNHRDYYIFGHRHIELDLMITSGARVVILGDMFRQWTYAQMDNNGSLMILNYETNNINE